MLASKKRRPDPLELFPAFNVGGGWQMVLSPVFVTLLFVPFFWRFGVWGKFGFRRQKTCVFCNNDLGVVKASFWREGSSLQGLVFKKEYEMPITNIIDNSKNDIAYQVKSSSYGKLSIELQSPSENGNGT